jgi:predicted outer membrane repeat protein
MQTQVSATSVTFANVGQDSGFSFAIPFGGALNFLSSKVELKRCLFVNNSAANGGAIQITNSSLYVIDSSFDGNMAIRGGAIYSDSSVLTIDNTTIQNGYAIDVRIWISNFHANCTFLISILYGCHFIRNCLLAHILGRRFAINFSQHNYLTKLCHIYW